MVCIREYAEQLGGNHTIAVALGVGYTTVHSHISAGRFPASWYKALYDLSEHRAVDEPPLHLFSFKQLTPVDQKEDAA